MKVFIVYCHPSQDSFTRKVYESFTRGLDDAGTAYCTSVKKRRNNDYLNIFFTALNLFSFSKVVRKALCVNP